MKGKCRIKAIILIIQAQILFFCCTVGRLPQFSALLWLQRPILIQPWVTQFFALTSFHFLKIPVWPLISWARGIISTAVRKIPSIWTHPADQRTLEVEIKLSWKVAFILQIHSPAEVVPEGRLGHSPCRVHVQCPLCLVRVVNRKAWPSLRKFKGRRKSTHVTIDPLRFPWLFINSLDLSSLQAALKEECLSWELTANNHCQLGRG